MHQKATIAKILAVTIAVICSYALNSQWAFQERGGKRSTREAVSFFVVSAIGIVINAIPLWFSRNVLGLALTSHGGRLTSQLAVSLWDFLFGSIIGMLLAMLWRWWAFDKFVFPKNPKAHDVTSSTSAPADNAAENGTENSVDNKTAHATSATTIQSDTDAS